MNGAFKFVIFVGFKIITLKLTLFRTVKGFLITFECTFQSVCCNSGVFNPVENMCGTHDVRALRVVEGAGGAAVAGEHLRHVLRLILGEPHEAHPRTSKHF